MSAAPGSSAPRPAREIPNAGLRVTLRGLLGGRRERVDMLSGLRELHDRHGEVVQQVAGPLRFVNLFGPDANRTVLLDRERIFSAQRPWTAIMGRIFPGGLLLRDGAEHRHHRKIMHTAFRRAALREYGERMNPMIDERLDAWAREGELLAFPAFKELTLDMAASIFLGEDLGPATRTMNRAFEDLVAASMSRVRLPIPGLEFHRGLKAREFMKEFLGDRIAKKRAGDGPDMFTRLCHAETEEGDRLEDDEVVDHMIFLMMAAHDTLTSTLTTSAYALAAHPEWQERLRAEARSVGEGPVQYEDLDRLEQTDWLFSEAMRMWGPVPYIPRRVLREFEWEGYRIPANSQVTVSPDAAHRDPNIWTAPERFDPERFSPERAEHKRHAFAYAPYGGGVHKCLGMHFAAILAKVFLHRFVLTYECSVPEGYEYRVQQVPIPKPKDGLKLDLSTPQN